MLDCVIHVVRFEKGILILSSMLSLEVSDISLFSSFLVMVSEPPTTSNPQTFRSEVKQNEEP